MLALILIFFSVFLLVFALAGGLSQPKVDVKKRMDNYLNKVTAEVGGHKAAATAKEVVAANEAVKQLRDVFEKYGRKIEERGYTERIELELQKADLPLRGYEFIFIIMGTTAGAIFLIFLWNQNIISMAVAGLLGFFGPLFILKIKQQKRVQKFNAQIGDSLVLISNSLKAGYGFMQAVEMVAKEMTPPIQSEFARVMQEINLGTTTEEALVRMTERVNSNDMDLVITAMLIQRQIGGNLSEILDNISHTIRERVRIAGEVKTLTAQGRLSGFIIGSLPLALGMLLLMINPKYMMDLFTDPRGQFMIGYAVVAEIIAIIIIKKIITIKV
ncbi:MAG TPA: type II secretion system F family protein [Bacillota bacterium]|nr:type II secretion system F family protein [Bacillota bacterium]